MLHDILLVLPEEIISLSALALMMIAAWAGDRAAPALTWLAVLTLGAALVLLPASPTPAGPRSAACSSPTPSPRSARS